MVKPGGTGRPRFAISARPAPLPPSSSRRAALPSARPSPKVKTHLPDFVLLGLEAACLRFFGDFTVRVGIRRSLSNKGIATLPRAFPPMIYRDWRVIFHVMARLVPSIHVFFRAD